MQRICTRTTLRALTARPPHPILIHHHRHYSTAEDSSSVQDAEQVRQTELEAKKRAKMAKSKRRQNMIFSLLGGAALVGAMVLLVRGELGGDKRNMEQQVERVAQIKTRMEREEEERQHEKREYEAMLDRRRMAHELPREEPSMGEKVKTELRRRWNSLFLTLGDSLSRASQERQEKERKRLLEKIYSQLEDEKISRDRVVKIRATVEE